ncbi:hypothetical protein EVA_15107 [gut metagenome]|uniref:Uncharacterized protein n=1 Tax=gut metagenome TaxID=749906 RepID=J9G4P0_9ZZZZ
MTAYNKRRYTNVQYCRPSTKQRRQHGRRSAQRHHDKELWHRPLTCPRLPPSVRHLK